MKFSIILFIAALSTVCNRALNLRGRELATAPATIVSSYIGAWPAGIAPPALSSLPSNINMLMLSFAKDPSLNGNMVPFNGWSTNLNPSDIAADRIKNPNRRYLVSVGGDASAGGTFGVASGISNDQWVDNAFNSISSIIKQYHLDGYEAPWEGGVNDPHFQPCLNALNQKMQAAGFIVALGPFYDGTSTQYGALDLSHVDIVNMQMYATGANDVPTVISQTEAAMNAFGGASNIASKFVFGANSMNRAPSPAIALQAFQQLRQRHSIRGGFTWDAEHSQHDSPAFCIENNFQAIINGQQPSACDWS